MTRPIRRLTALAAALALGAGAATAMAGDPPPTGPVYPPPGGVTLGSSGDNGRPGGGTWTYGDLEVERFDPLWWSVQSDHLPRLAIDGAIDEPGEFMSFSASGSDLAAGRLVFTGSVDHPVLGTYPSSLTVTVTSGGQPVAMDAPGDVGLPEAIGGAAVIGGDFQSNVLFRVNGVPAKDWFDNARTDPNVDDEGLKTSVAGAFYYVPANELPIAQFSWTPETPTAGRTVELTSTSSDPDGEIVSTEWDLDGDGEYDDATGETASTTFASAGDHEVGVRVTDDRDDATTARATVTVVPNELPEASFTWSPESPKALQEVTFTSTSTDADGEIVSTEWDLDGDGSYDDATGESASRTFDEAGQYEVGVRVTDDLGGVSTATETVGVRTCDRGVVSQSLRSVGAVAGIEPTIRQINCDVLEPLGL